jgi:hypothetical protein
MQAAGAVVKRKGLPNVVTDKEVQKELAARDAEKLKALAQHPLWPIIIFVDGMVPPSKNEMNKAYRHWAARRDLRLLWAKLLDTLLSSRHVEKELLKESAKLEMPVLLRVQIARHRLLDDTAIVFGFEGIKDILTLRHQDGLGWICDDRPTKCTTEITQHKATRIGTTISIQPRRNHA